MAAECVATLHHNESPDDSANVRELSRRLSAVCIRCKQLNVVAASSMTNKRMPLNVRLADFTEVRVHYQIT